jgi:CubicO group peptidase (beta-lactamase class C family)
MSTDHYRRVLGAVTTSLSGLVLAVLAWTSPHADAAQQPADVAQPPGPVGPPTMAVLEGSLDWGDLGPDWRKELAIYGDELLLFRWKINAFGVAKGRWQISDPDGTPLAQGEVGAAQTPGQFYQFSLKVADLGLSPPLRVRIQALSGTNGAVGHVSPPVVVNLAVNTGFGTCFTDGGLGLPIADKLEVIRAANGVPAIGGAIVTKHGLEVFDAVGIRKIEPDPADAIPVTKFDSWHLGSDTKAMTATLVGILHQLSPSTVGWDTTIADAFPEWVGTIHPTMAQTTLRQLLAHRSGLYKFSEVQAAKLSQSNLSVTQQRRAFTQAVVQDPYLLAPGVLFSYQNANFVIAGAMLENLFQQSWENLISQYLFQPLGMTSAGFGPPALGGAPEPWGHWVDDGSYTPTNGDNPMSLGPAGTVHASLGDWAKFIRLFLKGSEGAVTLNAATLSELTTAYTSNDPWFAVWPQSYGWGWIVFGANGDESVGHDGSNGSWYARANVYLKRGYALLAVTNSGGDNALEAMNDTVNMLEAHHSNCPNNAGRVRRGSFRPGGWFGGFGLQSLEVTPGCAPPTELPRVP